MAVLRQSTYCMMWPARRIGEDNMAEVGTKPIVEGETLVELEA